MSTPSLPNPDRILDAFNALTTVGNISSEHFRQVVDSYPELLTREALFLIRALGAIQKSDDAKKTVEEIAGLLEQCQQQGVDAALFARMRQSATDRSKLRLDEERARKRNLRFATDSTNQFGNRPLPTAWKSFPCLAECVDFIRSTYVQSTIPVQARPNSGSPADDLFTTELPRYLFRGESGIFPSTVPSAQRLRTDVELPLDALEDIVRVTHRIRETLIKKHKLPALLTDGFMQHYGLPTDYLDLTPDLEVAICFATDLSVGQRGAFCIAQTKSLGEQGRLVDLRGGPFAAFAARPCRQSAFAFTTDWSSSGSIDLKSERFIEQLDLTWLAFEFTDGDARRFDPNPELLDAHNDRAAGFIELIINSFGKMHDSAARWIANRLQPAPLMVMSRKNSDRKSVV